MQEHVLGICEAIRPDRVLLEEIAPVQISHWTNQLAGTAFLDLESSSPSREYNLWRAVNAD